MKNYGSEKKREPKRSEKKNRLTVSEPTELMVFLIAGMPGQSRNNIKSLLTHGQVLVDGKVIKQYNHPLQAGQEVAINWSLVRNIEEDREPDIDILYEDADIIVVDKPAGLLTIASDSEKEHTAYRYLMNHVRKTNQENRIFIVHRLDRDTSGVMLFAKNETVKRLLQDEWKEVLVERAYIALVEGQVLQKEGTIKTWLLETKTKLMYSSHRPGKGLEAVTRYKVLIDSPDYSLLEIHLETGRKNQIRVHMKDLGHTIVGDKKYGAKSNPIGRLALHAQVLSFRHPVTRELVRFETPIPPKFLLLLR